MSQYVLYGLGLVTLVLAGVGEYLHLLPQGSLGYIFPAVVTGVLGVHIPLTQSSSTNQPSQVVDTRTGRETGPNVG